MKKNSQAPAIVVISLLCCTAILLTGYQLEGQINMKPPAEYVYWEEESFSAESIPPEPVTSIEETGSSAEAESPENLDAPLNEALPYSAPDTPAPVNPPPSSQAPPPPSSERPASSKIYLDSSNEEFATATSEEIPFPDTPDVSEEESSAPSSEQISKEQLDPNRMINLNSAGIDDLCSLKGVGEVLAQRIIDYRNQAGGFQTIEDIMNVKGIAEGKFAAIKSRITV